MAIANEEKMERTLRIGLMGLSFKSANLGCAALAISFYTGLTSILNDANIDAEFLAIGDNSDVGEYFNPRYKIEFIEYHLSRPMTLFKAIVALKTCDIVFDFTEGDSFADIYGRARFYRSIALKRILEYKRVPLVLGPQTYGPFDKPDCRLIAKKIINNAYKVYSRDDKSKKYLDEIGVIKKIDASTDVAFRLPYFKSNKKDDSRTYIGINVSGLLWEDSESGKNSLGLSINYREYIKGLVTHLGSMPEYKIFLIPHVGTEIDGIESDYGACYKVYRDFPNCTLLEGFKDPIKAKTALAQMDIVIAARMHASIGAFSSGVFTIPFAYSRKFEGYYGKLNYPIMVDGKSETTQTAIAKTIDYIKEYDRYSDSIEKSRQMAEEMLSYFYADILETIYQVSKGTQVLKG